MLARELRTETGSVFVQISDENLHTVRNLLDEVFGVDNFVRVIAFRKTGAQPSEIPAANYDFIIWYAKNLDQIATNKIYTPKTESGSFVGQRLFVEDTDYRRRPATKEELASFPSVDGLKFYRTKAAQGAGDSGNTEPLFVTGKKVEPGERKHWSTTPSGMEKLKKANRLALAGKTAEFVWFFDDFAWSSFGTIWNDTVRSGFGDPQRYVVETNALVVERCMLMTTLPGDLVLDPTCGSGTTAFVAEKWGRRWITCDTSRVAITLAKQRLMTASFDYYALRYPHEGLGGGFDYETVPYIKLESIANNPDIDTIHDEDHPKIAAALADLNAALGAAPPKPLKPAQGARKGKPVDFAKGDTLHEWEVPFDWPTDGYGKSLWPETARAPFDAFHTARQAMQRRMDQSIADHAEQETLYDKPRIDKNKLRITGPFSIEAVPAPTVLSLDERIPPQEADETVARSGETSRQTMWRDELLKTGVRGKGGAMLRFAEFETLPGLRHIHASGSVAETGERAVVSFGPEHAALEQRQVEMALTEAETLRPSPKFILFCAFTFDPEAAKDIDEVNWPGVTLLKAQMNTDLLTEDLRRKRASNESFWLMGQPDVDLRKRDDGLWEVEVNGFDYFDPKKGDLVSGGKKQIAMWSLDVDYDNRSLMPHQMFFPMADAKGGWNRLRKAVRAELDEELLEQFHGTTSLPFEAGDHGRIAVKIVDDRGIESLKIMSIKD
ncbi:DNA methyltransferase [Roseovarius sp.]|uniref:DNA methyltransferase n=1 Tax=Roseovarius sp. TaxID=1486281 RepID=UPI003565F8B9